MKKIMLIILVSLVSVHVFSQDTLYTKTGNVIAGKVVEINNSEIKYKKASNPDGPVYVMDRSDMVLIHFKNGSKEVFSSNNNPDNSSVSQNNSANNSNQPNVVNNNYSYGYQRPGVNVIVGPVPYMNYNPWWGWGGGYYRPYVRYGGGYYHGYHGGSHHGGHYGHH